MCHFSTWSTDASQSTATVVITQFCGVEWSHSTHLTAAWMGALHVLSSFQTIRGILIDFCPVYAKPTWCLLSSATRRFHSSSVISAPVSVDSPTAADLSAPIKPQQRSQGSGMPHNSWLILGRVTICNKHYFPSTALYQLCWVTMRSVTRIFLLIRWQEYKIY